MATRASGLSPSATRLVRARSEAPGDVELVTAGLLELRLEFLQHGPHSDRGVHLDLRGIRSRASDQQGQDCTGNRKTSMSHRILPVSRRDDVQIPLSRWRGSSNCRNARIFNAALRTISGRRHMIGTLRGGGSGGGAHRHCSRRRSFGAGEISLAHHDLRGAVSGRRHDRSARAHLRAEAHRSVRPVGRGRKRRRRRRLDRRGQGRQGCARRLHAAAPQRHLLDHHHVADGDRPRQAHRSTTSRRSRSPPTCR